MLKIQLKKQLYWLWLSAFVIALDQLVKYEAVRSLSYHQPIEIFPVFNLILTFNRGSAWGFLNTAAGWQIGMFSMIAIIVSAILIFALYRLPAKSFIQAVGISLILGGAIGNLIDRFSQAYVVDFIELHYKAWYFPVFNLADLAITLGAACLILHALKKHSLTENVVQPS